MWRKLRKNRHFRTFMTTVAVIGSALLQTFVIQAFIGRLGCCPAVYRNWWSWLTAWRPVRNQSVNFLAMVILNIPVAWALQQEYQWRFTFSHCSRYFCQFIFENLSLLTDLRGRDPECDLWGVLYGFCIISTESSLQAERTLSPSTYPTRQEIPSWTSVFVECELYVSLELSWIRLRIFDSVQFVSGDPYPPSITTMSTTNNDLKGLWRWRTPM